MLLFSAAGYLLKVGTYMWKYTLCINTLMFHYVKFTSDNDTCFEYVHIPRISVILYKVWSNTTQSMPLITRFANITNVRHTYVRINPYPAKKCQYIYHKVLVVQKVYTQHASKLNRAHVPFRETYVFTVDIWKVCRKSALLMIMTAKDI